MFSRTATLLTLLLSTTAVLATPVLQADLNPSKVLDTAAAAEAPVDLRPPIKIKSKCRNVTLKFPSERTIVTCTHGRIDTCALDSTGCVQVGQCSMCQPCFEKDGMVSCESPPPAATV